MTSIQYESCHYKNHNTGQYTVQCKMVAGENFGEFGEYGEIRQNFTHPNLYHKTVGIKLRDKSIPSK